MSVLKLLRPESKLLLDGFKCLSIGGASKSFAINHIPVNNFHAINNVLRAEHPTGFGDWDKKLVVPGGSKELRWPSYNERIHPPTGEYRPAYICHVRDNIKYSPKKMWYVSQFMQGLSVDEALKQLQFIKGKGAIIAKEVLEEAVELAVKEHCVEYRSNLWIAEAFARKAQVIKGLRRHARGRFGHVEYKYIHFFLKLEEGAPPKHFYDTERFDPDTMLGRWIQEHREKQIVRM